MAVVEEHGHAAWKSAAAGHVSAVGSGQQLMCLRAGRQHVMSMKGTNVEMLHLRSYALQLLAARLRMFSMHTFDDIFSPAASVIVTVCTQCDLFFLCDGKSRSRD